jgi:hypothetical protein
VLLLLALLLIATPAAAQQQGYRWVDEHGTVNYAGRRDQVPERYRGQLPPEPAGPPKPLVPGQAATGRPVGPPVSAECLLRFRGDEKRRGQSRSFPDCNACQKALKGLGAAEASRAECVPTSVESYR